MKTLTLAAALVTLSLASPAMAQYRVMNYNYYGNPYVNSGYVPNVYGSGFNYQNSYGYNPNAYGYNPNAYGYNPNAYGYNPNAYFSPSNGNMYRSLGSFQNNAYRTYTYRYVR